VVIS
ncbi:ABC transporter transmembrane protein, partial [Gloeomargarita lithophora Alchichica-D10]|jgi:patatin-like phospholipase/acyl hydrolase